MALTPISSGSLIRLNIMTNAKTALYKLRLKEQAFDTLKGYTDFWKGKKVLVTGHTGFKGAWLSLWLLNMGAEITGISLEPKPSKNLFNNLF